MIHLNITIHGKVQGVGFRAAAKKEAEKLKLTGFARNDSNDTVHIEVEGDEVALNEFLAWCIKGPWFAKVSKVEPSLSDEIQGFDSFLINI